MFQVIPHNTIFVRSLPDPFPVGELQNLWSASEDGGLWGKIIELHVPVWHSGFEFVNKNGYDYILVCRGVCCLTDEGEELQRILEVDLDNFRVDGKLCTNGKGKARPSNTTGEGRKKLEGEVLDQVRERVKVTSYMFFELERPTLRYVMRKGLDLVAIDGGKYFTEDVVESNRGVIPVEYIFDRNFPKIRV